MTLLPLFGALLLAVLVTLAIRWLNHRLDQPVDDGDHMSDEAWADYLWEKRK